jgi:hypothetical protein
VIVRTPTSLEDIDFWDLDLFELGDVGGLKHLPTRLIPS